jgi:CheY-like chemotaxis protein
LSLISGGTRRTPVVVMISDMNRGPTYREVLEAGAFDVIASPCSKKDVQWMVLRAMQPEHLLHISKRN